MKANRDIRDMLEDEKIHMWEVANKLNMRESNFSVLMRNELNNANRIKILKAIKEIKLDRMSDV